MKSRKPFASKPLVPRLNGALTPLETANLISEKCLAEPINFKKGEKAYVFFVPHAWETFCASVSYGKWVPENELESHYFLEGYFFVDPSGVSSTVVTNIITPKSASQGKTSAQLYSKENNAYAMVQEKEAELIKYGTKGKNNKTGAEINPFYETFGPPCRVGFGHTHPNIGCFFSSVDRTSVFAVPGEPWITMVADPRREEILAAVGTELLTANVVTFGLKKKEVISPSQSNGKPSPVSASSGEIVEQFIGFIRFVDAQLSAGCSAKIKIGGKLPGTLKFKGEVSAPHRRKKTKVFRSKQ